MKRFISRFYPTLLVVTAILYLSLAHVSVTDALPKIPYFDKIAHCLMYLGLVSVFCFDIYRSLLSGNVYRKYLLWGWIFAVLLGGVMEMAQMYLTNYRSGDWADMAANIAGATLGIVSGRLLAKPLAARIGRYF